MMPTGQALNPDGIGRILTASEVAAIFNLDVRTVRRYYKAFGGVRIGRAIRFFENRIVSMSDADFHFKEKGLPETLEGTGMDGRQDGSRQMVRINKSRSKGGHRLGGADKKGSAGSEKKLQVQTPTDSSPNDKATVLEWANAYLEECERRNTLSTFKEKRDGFRRFMKYLATTEKLSPQMRVEDFGRREARLYLAFQKDKRGPNCSNKDRKVLTTAWRWGVAYLDGFPLEKPDPFLGCQRYPEIRTPRYIPPEEDFWKVYDVAPPREQALLTCYLNLAARKSELLRLTWDEVDFARNTVVLTTRKTRTGTIKRDEMPMNPEVRETMRWLWENRQGTSNYVFTCPVPPFVGQPYKAAGHVMERLCKRAGVKRFGFHAIRHLAATILAQEGHSLFSIQHSLRHEKQSTTDRYLHSLGAFREVADALGSLAGRNPGKIHSFAESSEVKIRRKAS